MLARNVANLVSVTVFLYTTYAQPNKVTCLRWRTERARLSPCTRPARGFPLLTRKNSFDTRSGRLVGQDGGIATGVFFRWCCRRITTRMNHERAASLVQRGCV